MTGKTTARKGQYFTDGFYSMHSDQRLLDIAGSANLPTAMRLYFLAAARMNIWGHAPFKPREIRQILKISEPTKNKAIESLKTGKVIAPESTYLCIVLDAGVVRRADRATHTCIEPSHVDRQRLMWAAGFGWETREKQWQENVNAVIARRITRKRRIVEEEETIEEVAHMPAPPAWATGIPAAPGSWLTASDPVTGAAIGTPQAA
jgi:hypothetical protein